MILNGVWLPANYELDFEYPKRVEILVDQFKLEPVPENEIRIIHIWEPTGFLISDVMKYLDFYTYVLTYHEMIVQNNPKARFFICVTCFVDPNIPHEKKFAVGTVVGHKRDKIFPGYPMRHDLWFKRHQITIPREFYLSGKTRWTEPVIPTVYGNITVEGELTVGQNKDHVFDTMFHIAIENIFMKYWFTEKILDCFLTRTVPIYIGAEAIGEFFNLDGIIRVATVDQAIEVCNKLTPEDYYSRTEAIEDNYRRALPYKDPNRMIAEKVLEILK